MAVLYMVTGASTADVAVILIDARKGVLTQTRRHSYLVSLLEIRQVVLAVNKMDLVEYSRERRQNSTQGSGHRRRKATSGALERLKTSSTASAGESYTIE
jgi:bifunctional enzyme CysN/CysC